MSLEDSTDSQKTTTSESQPASPRKRGRPRKSTPVSLEQPGDLGLGLKERRALNQELRRRGLQNSDLPVPLSDHVTKKSRKGKAGQIVVRALSGVQKSTAANLARKLENELSGGRDDIIEKLEASGSANQSIQRLAGILESQPQFSLARAIAEAGADVAVVLDTYTKGALALRKTEVVLNLYKEMPHMIRDLVRHAIDQEEDCGVCFGVGKVTAQAKGTHLTKTCPRCKGSGKSHVSSEHKEFAVRELLEVAELKPKKQGLAVNVNQGVQVNVPSGGGDLLARLSKAADEVLYHQATPGEVVDAEVVD